MPGTINFLYLHIYVEEDKRKTENENVLLQLIVSRRADVFQV